MTDPTPPPPSDVSSYTVIGVMSGTSLDGLDMAGCEFSSEGKGWNFRFIKGQTIPFPDFLQTRMAGLHDVKGKNLIKFHRDFGEFIGEYVKSFCEENSLKPDLVASHGHTVLHNPGEGYTFQAGHGDAIYEICRTPVVCDFRTADILKGGQGAPLVPGAEAYLFNNYDFCLNLGGIANLTKLKENLPIAFDVGPCNIILNKIASLKGETCDQDGKISSRGEVLQDLLRKLTQHPYYEEPFPKSLDKQEVLNRWWPYFEARNLLPEDMGATFCYHLKELLERTIQASVDEETPSVLVTGGGVKHPLIRNYLENSEVANFVFPEDEQLIDYKEAIAFGFLGLLRSLGEPNVFSTVTGAYEDHSAGVLHGDFGRPLR